ncbi:type II secretion system protein [bacterium]|nr:type II secretion system protein [bacterium]
MHKGFSSFTLAEITVVLALLGVLAGITIQNVRYEIWKAELLASLKVAYHDLSEAVRMSEAENGKATKWTKGSYDGYHSNVNAKALAEKYLIPYMDVMYICDKTHKCFYGANNEWFIAPPKNPNDTTNSYNNIKFCDSGTKLVPTTYNDPAEAYMFRLRNGMSYGVIKKSVKGYGNFVRINIDINGPNKGKSVLGQDVFVFEIHKDTGFGPERHGIHWYGQYYPQWYSGTIDGCVIPASVCSGAQYDGGGRIGCADYIIKNGWKITNEYPRVSDYYK